MPPTAEHTTDNSSRPVLILGAGINGCCLARELVLNRVPVILADRHDIAWGATAKSSRLIHGGVRYLEYGDFRLVRESLRERRRLLKLAPHYVHPLRLHIPVRRRTGGLVRAAFRFLGFSRFAWTRHLSETLSHRERGLWTVSFGLWLYDLYARDASLPKRDVRRVDEVDHPHVSPKYHWLCSYSDAQILSPERFSLALLEDTRRAAAEIGVAFRLLTRHRARRAENVVHLLPGGEDLFPTLSVEPATLVNATGGWGDMTLRELEIDSPQLFGGTKGSHIITRQPALREALGGDAVYAETDDGRLVFVLPLEDAVMVGTTDERIDGSPDDAVATPHDIQYLVGMVNEVFADVNLTPEDVDAHYCGVRPLPFVPAGRTAAISRGHWIDTNTSGPFPVDTLIGGKLTTCRAFAEQAADRILKRLGQPRMESTCERPIPGADVPPIQASDRHDTLYRIAQDSGFAIAHVEAVWRLIGGRTHEVLNRMRGGETRVIPGTALPGAFVDWVIEHEWVLRTSDLVERRLMLAWDPGLTSDTVYVLAERLEELRPDRGITADRDAADCLERLAHFYGRQLT